MHGPDPGLSATIIKSELSSTTNLIESPMSVASQNFSGFVWRAASDFSNKRLFIIANIIPEVFLRESKFRVQKGLD